MAINPMALLGGVGVVALGVVGGLYASGTASAVPMPKWRSAADDNNSESEYTTNTYANTYKRFLVGVGEAAQNKTPKSNEDWWKWVHENRFSKNNQDLKDKFSTVKKALGDSESLQSVCKDAYKAELSATDTDNKKIVKTLANKNTDKFLEDNIWKFCSAGETKIKTLKDMENEKDGYTGNNAIAKSNGNDAKLVSIKDKGTQWFWDLKQEEIKTANIDANTTSKFKELKTKLNGTGTINPEKDTVKEICKAAYNTSAETGDTGAYTKKEVGLFCTLSGTALS